MNFESLISTILVSVIGLAIVAVVVSNRANTASVIGASGTGLANVIAAAVSPVTGATSAASTGASSGLPLPSTLFSNSTFGGH
jgi:hypothetical protein